jgi:hypothetical protein
MLRVYEKYAWVVFLALGVLWMVVGFNQIFLQDELLKSDVELITDISWSELKASSLVATDFVRWLYGQWAFLKQAGPSWS